MISLFRQVICFCVLLFAWSHACAENAADRGFNESPVFRILNPKRQTAMAVDRSSTQVIAIKLTSAPLSMDRVSQRTFTFHVQEPPALARLHATLYGQGTDGRPLVSINGTHVSRMQPYWPSLTSRNYAAYAFDENGTGTASLQFDYEGTAEATTMIENNLIRPGENQLTIHTGTDRIVIQEMDIELLTWFDGFDTVHDFRRRETE